MTTTQPQMDEASPMEVFRITQSKQHAASLLKSYNSSEIDGSI